MSDSQSPLQGSTAILVLGMHRSGTSALTGTLARMGVRLGQEGSVLPPREDNPSGFYESFGIFAAHENMLTALGTSWDDPGPMPADWLQHPAAAVAKEAIREHLEAQMAGAPMWVVKDPRLSRVLPLWRELLAEIGVQVRYVLCVRHPLEVARSLSARDGFSEAKGIALWLRHTLEAVMASQQGPRVALSYDDLLTDWRQQVARLQDGLSLSFAHLSEQENSEIDAYLESAQRHQRIDQQEQPALAALALRAYEAATVACKGDWSALDELSAITMHCLAPFDALRQGDSGVRVALREAQVNDMIVHFDAQKEWFRIVTAYWLQRREGERAFEALSESLAQARADLERQVKLGRELQEQWQSSQAQEQRLNDALALSNMHISRLDGQFAQQAAELAQAGQELQTQRKQAESMQAALEQLQNLSRNRVWLFRRWMSAFKRNN